MMWDGDVCVWGGWIRVWRSVTWESEMKMNDVKCMRRCKVRQE